MSLGRFLQQAAADSPLALLASGNQNAVVAIREVTQDTAKAEEVVTSISECLLSNDFAAELDQVLGQPLASETEDEFVARASSSIAKLLGKFLDGDRNC